MTTIEQKAAETIMQEPTRIKIAGRTYDAPKPTLGNLIAISSDISQLPSVDKKAKDFVSQLVESLKVAQNGILVARIVATLILGTKLKYSTFAPARFIYKRRLRRLTYRLVAQATLHELRETAIMLLSQTEAHDFFALIAFLGDVNLTKATKTKTTASGQQ